MKIKKFAQSTFLIESGAGNRLLIDPGTYNFEQDFTVGDFEQVNVIVITHKHADHFDLEATKALHNLFQPKIITNHEIATILQSEMIEASILNIGQSLVIADFLLTAVEADHVIRGELIINFGLVVESGSQRIYHTSDTRYIDPQQLSSEKVFEPDVLCLPISNRGLVMGIDDALYFANEIKPKTIIPMHYDSPKDKDRVRPEYFIKRFQEVQESLVSLSQISVEVLPFGDELEI